jgi:hypothetical protein
MPRHDSPNESFSDRVLPLESSAVGRHGDCRGSESGNGSILIELRPAVNSYASSHQAMQRA